MPKRVSSAVVIILTLSLLLAVRQIDPLDFKVDANDWFILPAHPLSILTLISIAGMAVYWGGWRPKISFQWGLGLLGALLVFCVINSFRLQTVALDKFELFFLDWGIYLDVGRNTLMGNCFVTNETGGNFMGSHFEPLTILLVVIFNAFSSPYPFFLFTSLLLYANVPLIYYLARVKQVDKGPALALAALTALSVSLGWLGFARGYGFHDIYLFMPLLIAYFILLETRHFRWAWAAVIASFLLKETTPVIFAGLGIIFVIQGQKRRGAALFLLSAIYWIIVVKLVMPQFFAQKSYSMLDNFSHLGDSIFAVMLSPVTRPATFWGSILKPDVITFLWMLALPTILLWYRRPHLVLAGAISLGFVCVQKGDWLKSLGMQHHADALMLFYIAAVYGYSVCQDRRALTASLTMAALSFYCFMPLELGKSHKTWDELHAAPGWTGAMAELKELIPPKSEVTTSIRPGGHFMPRNHVYCNLADIRLSDYIILDLNSKYEDTGHFDKLRGYLVHNGYQVIFVKHQQNRTVVALAKTGLAPDITPAAFVDKTLTGEAGVFDNPYCLAVFEAPNLYLQLKQSVNSDLAIKINGEERVFADGRIPAYLCTPGQVIQMPVGDYLTSLELSPRPISESLSLQVTR